MSVLSDSCIIRYYLVLEILYYNRWLMLVLSRRSSDVFCIEAVTVGPALDAYYGDHATVLTSIAYNEVKLVARVAKLYCVACCLAWRLQYKHVKKKVCQCAV
jgi:hypothetical protein